MGLTANRCKGEDLFLWERQVSVEISHLNVDVISAAYREYLCWTIAFSWEKSLR